MERSRAPVDDRRSMNARAAATRPKTVDPRRELEVEALPPSIVELLMPGVPKYAGSISANLLELKRGRRRPRSTESPSRAPAPASDQRYAQRSHQSRWHRCCRHSCTAPEPNIGLGCAAQRPARACRAATLRPRRVIFRRLCSWVIFFTTKEPFLLGCVEVKPSQGEAFILYRPTRLLRPSLGTQGHSICGIENSVPAYGFLSDGDLTRNVIVPRTLLAALISAPSVL